MKIREDSLLYNDSPHYDYVDSYEYIFKDSESKVDIHEIVTVFTKPGPKWFEKLFALRDRIASVLKLKTLADTISEDGAGTYKWEVGKQAGIFKVFCKSENEIILGEDDSHLNFRVSLFLEPDKEKKIEKKVTVTTVVKYNNRVGKAYFFVVKPFHKAIVPYLLKRSFSQMELEVNK